MVSAPNYHKHRVENLEEVRLLILAAIFISFFCYNTGNANYAKLLVVFRQPVPRLAFCQGVFEAPWRKQSRLQL